MGCRTHLYGDIYSSQGLDLQQKQLLMVAFLSQAGMPDELFGHALAVGTYAPVLMACVEPKQLARGKASYMGLLMQVPPLFYAVMQTMHITYWMLHLDQND